MTVVIEESDGAGSAASAVSWAAVLAGVLVSVASTFLLMTLGVGLGFASSSPWATPIVGELGALAAAWIVVVQWLSSAAGGYLTGRLRTRWAGVHTHEVFFRDTAHGFLTWAVATVVVAAGTALVSTASAPQAAMAPGEAVAVQLAYDVDSLYRAPAADAAALATAKGEAMRILAASPQKGTLSPDDRAYLQASIASRSGVAPEEAIRRIDAVTAREGQQATAQAATADQARKGVAALAIITALAMFVGAFIASAAAALGGRERDEHL